jgi:hypothetical protein
VGAPQDELIVLVDGEPAAAAPARRWVRSVRDHPGVDSRPPTRGTARQVLAWCAAGVGVLGTWVSVRNPLNIEASWPYAAAVWVLGLVTAVALVAGVHWLLRPGMLRQIVTGVGIFLILASTCVYAWLAGYVLLGKSFNEEEVLARRGLSELVIVDLAGIEPQYQVELRRGIWPLRQSVEVWVGQYKQDDRADGARFVGPLEVAVAVPRDAGVTCEYRSRFDALTLDVNPVHRDAERQGAC